MTTQQDVLYEVRDRVALVTLNRPDRLNAYTPVMAAGIKRAFAEANNDPGVRAIVLTGAGRGFCAGADMDVLSGHIERGGERAAEKEDAELDSRFGSTLGPDLDADFKDNTRFAYFIKTKKPVIAAINGPIAGIGLVMALYADIRFAAAGVVLTTSFAQRGLIAEHGISWLLPKLVGPANALDLLLSARKIKSEEAAELGLVNKVFDAENFMDNVMAYAKRLAENVSPRSMAIMKAQVWKANFQNYNDALKIADAEMKVSLGHSEFKEGVAHFLEKRAAHFADI